jgi:hypothetical protein
VVSSLALTNLLNVLLSNNYPNNSLHPLNHPLPRIPPSCSDFRAIA